MAIELLPSSRCFIGDFPLICKEFDSRTFSGFSSGNIFMIRKFCFVAATVFLASCATVVDGQIQDVTIETQGAKNTLCYMQNRDFSFRFYPPQTLKVTKSPDPFTIRCLAPGNREKTIVVKPELAQSTAYNAVNAGTGVAVDHLSAAMYELPSRIVITFEGMKPEGYAQPPYNEFYDNYPELKGLEEFRPGQPALLRDAGTTTPSLQRREAGADSGLSMIVGTEPVAEAAPAADAENGSPSFSSPQVPLGSKGMSADSLTRSMNPNIFGGSSTPAANSAPVNINATP